MRKQALYLIVAMVAATQCAPGSARADSEGYIDNFNADLRVVQGNNVIIDIGSLSQVFIFDTGSCKFFLNRLTSTLAAERYAVVGTPQCTMGNTSEVRGKDTGTGTITLKSIQHGNSMSASIQAIGNPFAPVGQMAVRWDSVIYNSLQAPKANGLVVANYDTSASVENFSVQTPVGATYTANNVTQAVKDGLNNQKVRNDFLEAINEANVVLSNEASQCHLFQSLTIRGNTSIDVATSASQSPSCLSTGMVNGPNVAPTGPHRGPPHNFLPTPSPTPFMLVRHLHSLFPASPIMMPACGSTMTSDFAFALATTQPVKLAIQYSRNGAWKPYALVPTTVSGGIARTARLPLARFKALANLWRYRAQLQLNQTSQWCAFSVR